MKGLGWKKDIPDIRDFTFTFPGIFKKKILPSKIDLRPFFPCPYDQGELGSCTAQAVGSLCDFLYGEKIEFSPSTLFLYYVTRSLEGTIPVDAGATIRNTIKAVNELGICAEINWPYKINKFREQPNEVCYTIAARHQALGYKRVRQRLDDLRTALAEDFPVAFGFAVYESFYELNNNDFVIKSPGINESMLGGHAVVLAGYDDESQMFIVRNSWGEEWGNKGYFLMPYSFVLDPTLCSDFWAIELMEETVEEFNK